MEIINCENCKHMYKCEHTHMGSCSNGETWGPKTLGTKEDMQKTLKEIEEKGAEKVFVDSISKNTAYSKEELMEKMLLDIGPVVPATVQGKEEYVIFHSKESLAKVLLARGWVKNKRG